jgi:hypothetical protein
MVVRLNGNMHTKGMIEIVILGGFFWRPIFAPFIAYQKNSQNKLVLVFIFKMW